MSNFLSRAVSLWLLFVLFVAFLTELGCAVGLIPNAVLDAMAHDSALWWRQPLWLHAIEAVLLLCAAVWHLMLRAAPRIANRTRHGAAVSAVLLSSHLSPLYAVVPFVPIAGTVLALLMLGGLLLKSGAGLHPRRLLRRFLPAGRVNRLLWGCIGSAVLYCFISQLGETSRVVSRQTDFGTFYDAAVALTAGDDPYGTTEKAYFYPPTFAFYFRFLIWLPKAGASLLWFTVKLALAIWSLLAVYVLLRGPDMSSGRRPWFIAGVAIAAARFLTADLQFGNVNILILWLSLMAISLDFRERPALAGLASAAAISIKIVPAVFLIYFMFRGRIRALLWAVVWLIGLNLLPFLFDPHLLRESWTAYLAAGVLGKLGSALAQPDNQSLWGFLNRSLHVSFSQIRLMWIGCSALLAGSAALAAFRARGRGHLQQVGAASLFFLLGLLVSPGSWVVHYTAMLLPLSFLLSEAMANRFPAWWLWAVFAAANCALTVSGLMRLTVRLSIEQSWFVAASGLVFFTIAYLIVRRAPAAQAEQEG